MIRKNIFSLKYLAITLLVFFSSTIQASEEPVKHLELPDVTSKQEATQVFTETTFQLRQKTELDSAAMNDIHIITYSLEKAVAYFSENMAGEQQANAKEMAEVVEMIHLDSENNRVEETAQSLEKYFQLAEQFAAQL